MYSHNVFYNFAQATKFSIALTDCSQLVITLLHSYYKQRNHRHHILFRCRLWGSLIQQYRLMRKKFQIWANRAGVWWSWDAANKQQSGLKVSDWKMPASTLTYFILNILTRQLSELSPVYTPGKGKIAIDTEKHIDYVTPLKKGDTGVFL